MANRFSEDVLAAERLDAEGNHHEAVNALARATGAGDVEGMTRLGKRLLVGDRAPAMPAEGVSFIADAARAGGAEAAALLAMLVAGGIHRKQNWRDALALLLTAAERGWLPARRQLCALSGDAGLAAEGLSTPEVPAALWRKLAGTIDLGFWAEAPEAVPLSADPVVRSLPGFLPPAVCRLFVDRAAGRLGRARVYDSLKREETTHRTRTNTAATFGLVETDVVQLLVQARMARACGLPAGNMEAIAVLHYAVGEEITNHYDFVDPRSPGHDREIATRGQRVVTFLVYLNADYEGGETAFPKLGIRHRGAAGDGLFFVNARVDGTADLRTVHAGRPPSRGEKWVISQFIRDRRQIPGMDTGST